MTSPLGPWAVRGLAAAVGLVLPLTVIGPASAQTAVVRDGQDDGGLLSMTVKRSPVLTVTTYFDEASDLHRFYVREPGRTQPTFRLTWRPRERPQRITVTAVRAIPGRQPGDGTCRIGRADWDGPAGTKLRFTIPSGCLFIREPEQIERYQVNQKSYDVSSGETTLTDSLPYTRFVSARRNG